MSDPLSPSDFVRDWFEQVWNEHDEATIDRLVRPELTIYSRRSEEPNCLRGPEEFKPFLWALLDAFPDFKLTITEIVALNDKVSLKFVIGGTLSEISDQIPPSRHQIQTEGYGGGLVGDGEFVEGWIEIDMVPLNRQIGEILRSRVERRFEASQRGI